MEGICVHTISANKLLVQWWVAAVVMVMGKGTLGELVLCMLSPGEARQNLSVTDYFLRQRDVCLPIDGSYHEKSDIISYLISLKKSDSYHIQIAEKYFISWPTMLKGNPEFAGFLLTKLYLCWA